MAHTIPVREVRDPNQRRFAAKKARFFVSASRAALAMPWGVPPTATYWPDSSKYMDSVVGESRAHEQVDGVLAQVARAPELVIEAGDHEDGSARVLHLGRGSRDLSGRRGRERGRERRDVGVGRDAAGLAHGEGQSGPDGRDVSLGHSLVRPRGPVRI